jgi:hypothetical protein
MKPIEIVFQVRGYIRSYRDKTSYESISVTDDKIKLIRIKKFFEEIGDLKSTSSLKIYKKHKRLVVDEKILKKLLKYNSQISDLNIYINSIENLQGSEDMENIEQLITVKSIWNVRKYNIDDQDFPTEKQFHFRCISQQNI